MRILVSSILVIAVAAVASVALTGNRLNSWNLFAQEEGPRQKNAEKIERQEQAEKFERQKNAEKIERQEQAEKFERQKNAEKIERQEKLEREKLHGRQKNEGRQGQQPLGSSVELVFELGKGSDEPPLAVLCALREFSTHRMVNGPDGKHALRIAGELRPIGRENAALLIYEAEMEHANYQDDFEANFSVRGSAIVHIGRSYMLGILGEHPLRVIVGRKEEKEVSQLESAELNHLLNLEKTKAKVAQVTGEKFKELWEVEKTKAKELQVELERLNNSLQVHLNQTKAAKLELQRLNKLLQLEKDRAQELAAVAQESAKLADRAKAEALKQREIAEQALRQEQLQRQNAEQALKKAEEALQKAKEKQK